MFSPPDLSVLQTGLQASGHRKTIFKAVRCYGIFCMAKICLQLGKDTSPNTGLGKLPHQKAASKSVCAQLSVKETYSKNQPERA
tara:strand:- start:191 stop:442 length:252 start_codon:yes stop_codon:yes gene_type:complete